MSLFVIPTFHVSSSALLEVAVAKSAAQSSADAESAIVQAGADTANTPQNASDLESRGTVSGWSVYNASSTEQTNVWQPCRYYEVGDVEDDVRHVISNAIFGEELRVTSCFLRELRARALDNVAT